MWVGSRARTFVEFFALVPTLIFHMFRLPPRCSRTWGRIPTQFRNHTHARAEHVHRFSFFLAVHERCFLWLLKCSLFIPRIMRNRLLLFLELPGSTSDRDSPETPTLNQKGVLFKVRLDNLTNFTLTFKSQF